ncbi:MAG TPA: CBS domain-containing protein [Bryobacteraceae bacterium]|nr:CBS domain-containing protein [Bryobacteraceae bacterium]
MEEPNVLYCTELLGLKVYDTRRRVVGRVKDAALVPIIHPARVDRFLIGGAPAWLTIRFDQIQSISLAGIYLLDEKLTPYHSDEYMLRVVRDLLDQQIIDAQGRKVVRVTDLTFEIQKQGIASWLNVLEVDIGIRSIARRLLQGVVPPLWMRRLQKPIAPQSIRWEYCSIVESDPQRRLRLNISHEALERLHPADLADIVEELSPDDRGAIIETLHAEVAADALSEMDPDIQASILESLETEKAAEIIEEMDPDEAAHALAELEEETSTEILEEVDEETRTEVGELIEYGEHSAGFLMTTGYVAVRQTSTVADAIAAIRKADDLIETLNTIVLIDEEGRPTGAVPLARLFLASGDRHLADLKTDRLFSVNDKEKDTRVLELFDKYNILTLPVTAPDGTLAGVITADDVITALRQR